MSTGCSFHWREMVAPKPEGGGWARQVLADGHTYYMETEYFAVQRDILVGDDEWDSLDAESIQCCERAFAKFAKETLKDGLYYEVLVSHAAIGSNVRTVAFRMPIAQKFEGIMPKIGEWGVSSDHRWLSKWCIV